MQEKALLLHTSFENNLVSVEYFFHISTLSCVYLWILQIAAAF